MGLDIAFSDHNMAKQALEEFGAVVAAIHRASEDAELCFWTFIRYVSKNHPSILHVDLKPEMLARVEALLKGIDLPCVTLRASPERAWRNEHPEAEP
jgi:hypothetical protein